MDTASARRTPLLNRTFIVAALASALLAGASALPALAWAGDPSLQPEADAGTTTTSGQTVIYAAEIDAEQGWLVINVPGTYQTSTAQALIDRVNEIRAEAASLGLVDDDGNAVSGTAISWSTGLEHVAQVRAAEASFSFSHDRPNGVGYVLGTGYTSVQGNTFAASEGTSVWAEDLAMASDAASALELWYAEKDAYIAHLNGDTSVEASDYGHYASLISESYSYIALGAFTAQDGYTYLVAELSDAATDSSQVRTDGACIQQINVKSTNLSFSVSAADGADLTQLEAGSTAQLALSIASADGIAYNTASPLVWASQYTDYATVDANGLVSALSAGSTDISANIQVGDVTTWLADVNITVVEPEPQMVSVPQVTGMSSAAAQDMLTNAGFVPAVTVGDTAADESQNGVVYDVDPAEGTEVEAGSTVTLTVYADYVAPVTAEVPDLTGLNADEAGTRLQAVGLLATVVEGDAAPSADQNGLVYATDPAAGAVLDLNAYVTLYVYSDYVEPATPVEPEPEPAVVTAAIPQVSGMSGASAQQALENAGFVVSLASGQAASDASQNGVVYAVDPAEGTELALGSTVTVTVYSDYVEPEPEVTTVEVPDVTNMSIDDAGAKLEAAGLLATVEQDAEAQYPAQSGVVYQTDPAAGSTAELESTVTLYAYKDYVEPTAVSVIAPDAITTPSGTAPTMPAGVTLNMSDGSTAWTEDVAWDLDDVDPSAWTARAGGSFTVSGKVARAGQEALDTSVTVNVTPASVVAVASISLSTEAGVAPALPATVQASWSNGDTTDEIVAWDAIDASAYADENEFTVNGAVGDTGATVQATVSVAAKPAPTIVSVESPQVTTASGTAPQLPAQITATMSDGSTQAVDVAWNAVSAEQYAGRAATTFDVSGTVEGLSGVAVAHVSVEAASITEIAQPEAVSIIAGQEPVLPSQVSVKWSNGDTTDEVVSWDDPDTATSAGASPWSTPGEVVLTGHVEGTDLAVSITVNVNAASVVSIASLPEVSTLAGVAPTLPATVQVSWDDGTTTDESITWDALDASAYAQAGEFEAGGTVAGANDARVSVKISVTARATIASVDKIADVTVASGTAPTLPTSVNVTWSDGVTSSGTIAWEIIDESLYTARAGGAFDVEGTVSATHPVEGANSEATTATAQAKVHVIVTAATVVSVDPLSSISTKVKTGPILPQNATVHWSNGDATAEIISWDPVEASSYAQAGTFTVNGTVGTTGKTVSCVVSVIAAKASSVASVSLTTPAGVAPTLPSTVEVKWDDGTTTAEPVSWSEFAASQYMSAGTFTVKGSLGASVGLTVSALVTVTDPVATGAYLKTNTVNTVAGVAPVLPSTAQVSMSNETTQEQKVTWPAVDASKYAKAGTFTVTGTASGFEVTLTVNVAAAQAQKTADVNVTTTAGTAPVLPSTVKVTWSNGTVTDETAAWQNFDASLYAQPGSFTVKGTAANLSVTAHVTVTEAPAVTKTGDSSISPVVLAAIGVAGAGVIAAGIVLVVKARKGKKA